MRGAINMALRMEQCKSAWTNLRAAASASSIRSAMFIAAQAVQTAKLRRSGMDRAASRWGRGGALQSRGLW
jgi:hypothetical protein